MKRPRLTAKEFKDMRLLQDVDQELKKHKGEGMHGGIRTTE
jgi:hypothetical protein